MKSNAVKTLKGNAAVGVVVAFAVFVIVVMLILGSFMGVVDTGHRGVVTHWSKVTGEVKGEGFYFKTPFSEDVIEMNVQVQKEEADASAASRDLQDVNAKVAVNYQLNESAVGSIYQDMRKDYAGRVITPSIQEVVKASTALFTAEELITRRSQVKDLMTNQLREKLQPYGITVKEVNLVNFGFSDSFNGAIENKVRAEQDALAAKNKLEQSKYEAQQVIETARGESESIRIRTEALAQSQSLVEFTKAEALKISAEKGQKIVPDTVIGSSDGLLFNLNR